MITHGPDDPMCCPSVEKTLKYQLLEKKLKEVETEAETTEP